MAQTNQPANLLDRIIRLERELAEVRKRAGLGNAVSRGVFRFLDDAGAQRIYFGTVLTGSDFTTGWIFSRASGANVFELGGSSTTSQYWALRDEASNILFGDDAVTGQGLARPWLPIPFTTHSSTAPTDKTTSGAFTGLLSARYTKQHPTLRAQILCQASDGSTSGEVQLIKVAGGVQIGTTITVGLGFYGLLTIQGDVPGAHMEDMELEVQVRRTAGAGTVGVRMFGCYGQQSP